MGKMWLILNSLENEIDRKIGEISEEMKEMEHKINGLLDNRAKIGELREIEKKLSKKGLV